MAREARVWKRDSSVPTRFHGIPWRFLSLRKRCVAMLRTKSVACSMFTWESWLPGECKAMARGRVAFLIVLACWTCPVVFSFAEDTPAAIEEQPTITEQQPAVREEKRPYTLTVGIREWISQGRSAHNIGAPDGHPNVLSELSWRGMNSVITEVNADLLVKRAVLTASIGYGTIGGGTLLDQDWNGDN